MAEIISIATPPLDAALWLSITALDQDIYRVQNHIRTLKLIGLVDADAYPWESEDMEAITATAHAAEQALQDLQDKWEKAIDEARRYWPPISPRPPVEVA